MLKVLCSQEGQTSPGAILRLHRQQCYQLLVPGTQSSRKCICNSSCCLMQESLNSKQPTEWPRHEYKSYPTFRKFQEIREIHVKLIFQLTGHSKVICCETMLCKHNLQLIER